MQCFNNFLIFLSIYLVAASINITENDIENNNSENITVRFFPLPSVLPSFSELLTIKKNILAAYPFEIAATAVDILCSSTLFFHSVPPKITPDIQKMHFQLITPCKNYSVPLLQAKNLWRLKAFDRSKKVVILATGWTNTVNHSSTLQMLSEAFLCRKDVNFIIVDAAKYIDTFYKWSALNTEDIGEHIATGLVQLKNVVKLQNIHLVGHSLGAHIMGSAGRTFTRLTGELIPRITGLDPAKPCFRRNDTLSSLRKTDAYFVDVIHTNIGILAKREPIGHMDFYPGGANALPPGCLTIQCAHSRAVEYFAESIYPGNEHNFMASYCESWQELKQQTCSTGHKKWMGYMATRGLHGGGIYNVNVNWRKPYGKLAGHRNSIEQRKCHLC